MDKDKPPAGNLEAGSSQDNTNPLVASRAELERIREKHAQLAEKYKSEGGYDYVIGFDDDESPSVVRKGDELWYIKLDGTELSKWRYDNADLFYEGRAVVRKGTNVWFIKEDGSDLSNQTYDDAHGFRYGLATVKRDGKLWFIKLDGTNFSEEQYDQTTGIKEGRVRVWQGDESWYISTKTGKKIPGTEGGKY